MNEDLLLYYTQPGQMTDLSRYASHLKGLSPDVPALCRMVQGLMVHVFWADRYGLAIPDDRRQELQIRPAGRMLERILELDASPLTVARPLTSRLVSNCRDFTTLTVALLRHLGVPARARCGFGTYFEPGRNMDHWVCEVWRADQNRWVMFDAQIDDLQREALHLDFDPLDMPPGKFLTGGEAWQRCRSGRADPGTFGILDMWGLWFVCGDLLRDFAALNKVELLPWDAWGLNDKPFDDLTPDEMELLDRIAALITTLDGSFPEIRACYEAEDALRVPPVIASWPAGAREEITLADEI